ncbi:hypothetical protein [Xanthomonas oryzae]|uniref:hypothetical protein n=1 Tax=Xanthomonas oryzae TaxID=347 RepID=UPI0006AC9011|nr:hypothetical protein [Xanthomonas oryzae]
MEDRKRKFYRKIRKNKPLPPKPHTIEQLRELIAYDPETGVFSWRKGRKGVKPGSAFGTEDQCGSWFVRVDKYPYRLHYLAWALVHRYWAYGLDHVDWDKGNNKLSNIVESDRYESAAKKLSKKYWLNAKEEEAHEAALVEDQRRSEGRKIWRK